MSKNNFQERLRKMEDTKQRFSIRKFSIGAASVLIGLTIFGMGNETVHAAEQPAQKGVQTAVNKESNASKAKQETETSVNVNSEVTEKMQEVSVDKKASTEQPEKKTPASADVKEENLTSARKQNATNKQDSASAQTSQPAVDSVKQNAERPQQAGNDKAALATTTTLLAKTTTLNVDESSVVGLTESKAKAADQDEKSITVTDANGLIDAIKGTATTINVANDINLGTITDSQYNYISKINNRDFTIQSATPGTKHKIDFSGYCFNMSSQNSVTFKDLNIYSRTYWGVVYNAGGYTFDNVNFTGSQLVYTKPSINSTVTFKNTVNATAVGSYTSPLDGKTRSNQGGNTQQILQFEGGNNKIIFDEGSNVTLTTTNSNVLEIDGGTTNIEVKNGANVTLNPHSKGNPETLNSIGMGKIARAIASKGTTDLTVDKGAKLNINLVKDSDDSDLSGAFYLNSGATINVNGDLNINSNGESSYKNRADYVPVYVNGTAAINVNGGNFKVNATNMGDNYSGPIVSLNGKSTIAINHHGTFDVTGDGTQATGVSLGSGSIFTSTQPELFNISMPDGATAIKNGKVQFKGVKTSADGQPIGEIDITYAANGTPTVTKVTSYDEATTTATRTAENNAKNKINLIAAGQEVDLKDITFTKDADGNYIMSGNANTAADTGAYVYISVNGTVKQVPTSGEQTLYTVGETGDPTSSQVPYTAETGADGKFSVNLGKLNDNDQVSLYAAKDFVTSDTDTKTVSEWMTSSYRDQLQKLVDEASTVEAGSNFTNATDNLKTAYTSAISAGSALLQNSSATSEQLEAAANAIVNAKTALNGDLNKVKQDLQDAVDAAPAFEKTSATYYNADTTKQKAYTNAVAAGSTALNDSNATVDSLTAALKNINNAKNALAGQPTNKQDLQDAVNKSKDVKNSNNYTNADQNAKTAYDNAVTAAQSVLDNENATQAQVTQALQDLNTANSKLNGDAKTDAANRQALEAAVKDAPNVRNTPAYYNGGSKVQDAYNNAITDGQAVLDNKDATPAEVKNALDAITAAKNALAGQPTNKQDLQDAVNKSKDVKNSNNYTNADQNAKTAYDNAVTAAQSVLDNENATQAQVTQALQDLNTANSKLNGDAKTDAANRQALEAAVKDAPNVRNTPAYYNGGSKVQDAYNNAITDGQAVLDNKDATPAEVKNALDAITAAKNALAGQPTNKQDLQDAVNKSKDVKNSNNYTNADQNAKTAYDNAVTAAQSVLDNENATQAQVTQALQDLNTANSKLNGDAKTDAANRQALEAAVKDAPNVRNTPAYYNGGSKVQDAYNNAITDGQAVLDNKDATPAEVKNALDAITAAKNALAGQPTNKQDLQDAVNKSKDVKNSNNYTNADQNAKTAYDDAVKAGQQLLDPTTAPSPLTQADVDRAIKAITDAQIALTTSATTNVKDTKGKATADLTTAVIAAKAAIDQDTSLTEDERNAAKAQVDRDASAAREAINKATTNDAVTSAATAGKVAIDKTVANAAIDNAVAGKKAEISNAKDLSSDDVKALNNEVDQAAKAAKGAISSATTEDAVKEAQTDGVDKINAIDVATTAAKDKAKSDIDQAANDAKKAIDDNKDLTDDQKTAAKDQIDQDATKAKDNINNAKTDKDAEDANNAGQLAIAKDGAKAAIQGALNKKLNEIDSASALTSDEKAKLTNDANTAATNANKAIDAATTPTEVTSAQTAGIQDIENVKVPAESTTKSAADKAIDEALAKKQAEINKSTTLTDEEKTNLDKQAQNAANTAKQNIANAKTDSAVATAKDNGVAAIDGIRVPTNSTAKDQAKSNITDAADKAKQAIDQDNNLTNDQKQAAKNQVDTDAKNAQDAIDNAKTDADVNNAVDNGKLAIDKTVADAAIDNVVAGKIKDVKAPLTTDEQKTLTDLIKETGENAKQNIANATTPADVTTAQNNGVKAINDINIPTNSSVKDNATAAIDKALQNKKNEINNATNITAQEKQDLIKQATDAANTAKDNINNATSDSAVITAQTNGEKAIADVTIPGLSDIKKESTDLINKTLDKKKDEINNASNLSNDEKQQLINDATKAATDAINNINNAKTNDEAKAAADTGVQNIENISIPSLDDAKKDANQAIDDALESKTNEINNASNLTDKEKQNLIAKANAAAKTAKDNINSATTNAAVKKAEENGVEAIKSINFTNLDDAKKAANNAIDNALTNKTNEINNASNLSQDEKQDLINKVTDAANTAKDNINSATTNDAVTNAQNKGIEAIANVTVPSLAETKQEAIEAIKQVQAAKDKQISAAKNLDADQQKALTDQVDKIAKDAIAKINDPATTTNDAVKTARDNAIDQITNLFIPTLDGAQKDANDAINAAKQAKTDEINNAANLTDQEKQNLIDKVNKAADEATNAIKNATTDNAVKDAETKGLNEINGVTIPTLTEKQQAANVAIDQAAKAKKAEIAKALQAGNIDQAKADSLNTEVDNDVTNAMKAVANATTNAAVIQAQTDGVNKINAIKVPSSTYNPDITDNTSTGSGDTDSTSTKPTEETILKLILTHNAYIYNKDYQITYKDNKRVVLKKDTQIIALDNGKKYLIKGKEFYRIGDNQYVKVSNTISYYYLVHNSFLYNKHGKAIKRNGKRVLVRKGVRLEVNKVKVVRINGKKFYKVGKSTYIKFRNVKLIVSPNN